MTVTFNNQNFKIIHRTNKKIKRITLAMENKNEIVIRTPLGFKAHRLKEIAYEFEDWILRSTQKVPYKNSFDFVTGGTVPFLGRNYPMKLEEDQRIKNVKFSFKEDHFLVQYNQEKNSYEDFTEGLKRFYKHNALKIIDPIFKHWSEKTQLYPNKISYRFNKRRWGSCSIENNISINYKLLQFDKKCIEYVVLHELCHIEQKNHSKRFWELVSSFMSEYKLAEKQLNSNRYL